MSTSSIPTEFTQALANNPLLKEAFQKLSTEKQNEYINFFNGAEEGPTRIARIEKNTDRILKGYGRTDCTCGLSQKMPQCDGSHKQLSS
jgi:uncharacterized protein YdeI (YjbR/CyaY-like superfamily)